MGEQPVFDLVPLAGARRQVAHGDPQSGGGGEAGEFGFPQPGAVPVGTTAVGADHQAGSIGVHGFSDFPPPGCDGVDRELGGVVVGAHRHPPGVGADVVDPVRIGLAEGLVGEVVDLDLLGVAGWTPLPATVLVGPHQLFLLGVDADHRIPGIQVVLRLVVEVAELGVAVGVLIALDGLGVGLQAVAPLAQQPAGHEIADLMAFLAQSRGQDADRFRGPSQR